MTRLTVQKNGWWCSQETDTSSKNFWRRNPTFERTSTVAVLKTVQGLCSRWVSLCSSSNFFPLDPNCRSEAFQGNYYLKRLWFFQPAPIPWPHEQYYCPYPYSTIPLKFSKFWTSAVNWKILCLGMVSAELSSFLRWHACPKKKEKKRNKKMTCMPKNEKEEE